MAKLHIGLDDINRSRILDPDWYPVEIVDVVDTASKGDGSLNTTLNMSVIDGPFKGAMLYRLFNEKAPGFAIPVFEVFLGKGGVTEGDYDLHALKGKKLMVYVKNELYQGNMQNRVEGFRAL
jgi:hypothetical protein